MEKVKDKDGNQIAVLGNPSEAFWNNVVESTKLRIEQLEEKLKDEIILIKGAKRELLRAKRDG